MNILSGQSVSFLRQTNRVAVALYEDNASWDVSAGTTSVSEAGDRITVTGSKSFVIDGDSADTLVVAGRSERGDLELILVPRSASGVTTQSLGTMDLTRRQATVDLDDVKVPISARLEAGDAELVVRRLEEAAVTALSFEQVGGAQRCLEMSVEYAKDRVQFGRPIGSFQAIKHKCADMLVAVEGARSAAHYAGWTASQDHEDRPIAAALASSFCSEAFFDVAAETIQVHGGIGFTWEHDAHLYFKRAQTDRLLFGAPSRWRAVLAEHIGV